MLIDESITKETNETSEMSQEEILKCLFEKYNKVPQVTEYTEALSDLLQYLKTYDEHFELRDRLQEVSTRVAFDNFCRGFKVAIQIMKM